MRKFTTLGSAGLALTLILAACGQSGTPSASAPTKFNPPGSAQNFVSGQVVVGLAEGQSAQDAAKLVGARVLREIPRLSAVLLQLPGDMSVEKAIRVFAGAGEYRYAEPNYINTRPIDIRATNAAPAAPTLSAQDVKLNDPQIGRQWFLANMNAPKAWETATGKGVRIGIADEDIDRGHPDLRDNMAFPGFDAPEGKLITAATPYDKFGDHGTVVAGTAAAVGNNGKGGAGVAYQASIVPLTITHEAGASNVNSALAFLFGVDGPDGETPGTPADTDTPAGRNGYVDIINYSFGGSAYSQLSKEAIDYVLLNKVVFVTSAGNTPTTGPASPAWMPGVISVAATTPRNERTSFSNRGAHLTVAAPGENIWVTSVRSNVEDPNEVSYQYINGTSFSSPATAGTAALILQQAAEKDANGNITKINLTPAQVRHILEDTAFKPTGSYNIDTGNGVVRAGAAVTRAGQNAAATVAKGATVQMKFVARSDNSVGVPLVGVTLVGGTRPEQFLYGQSAAGNALFPTGVVTFAEVDAGLYKLYASGPRTVIAGGTAGVVSGTLALEAGDEISIGNVPITVTLPTDAAEPNNTTATATATAYGKVVRGVLGLSDVDVFTFTGAQDDTVFVNAQTGSGSPNLKVSLLNAAGTVIATNSSQRTGVTDAALSFKLPTAGQYFVRVESENVGNPFNTYWMSLGRLVGTETEPNGSVTANGETLTNLDPTGANPLAIGEARDASLATETDTDVYTFEGTAGQTIVADVNATVSGQPDGLLALFRQGVAAPLAVVDDTNTQDPTIEYQLQETGTYYLVFVPYITSTQKSKGDYRISLSAY